MSLTLLTVLTLPLLKQTSPHKVSPVSALSGRPRMCGDWNL